MGAEPFAPAELQAFYCALIGPTDIAGDLIGEMLHDLRELPTRDDEAEEFQTLGLISPPRSNDPDSPSLPPPMTPTPRTELWNVEHPRSRRLTPVRPSSASRLACSTRRSSRTEEPPCTPSQPPLPADRYSRLRRTARPSLCPARREHPRTPATNPAIVVSKGARLPSQPARPSPETSSPPLGAPGQARSCQPPPASSDDPCQHRVRPGLNRWPDPCQPPRAERPRRDPRRPTSPAALSTVLRCPRGRRRAGRSADEAVTADADQIIGRSELCGHRLRPGEGAHNQQGRCTVIRRPNRVGRHRSNGGQASGDDFVDATVPTPPQPPVQPARRRRGRGR